ncbi:Crp/Fnr family transcriptional regulator [Prevotella dentasini]|uniref:Crp/Fnr family transcriptional regulator n=1 Tax=Prevotella dentasini TaxID=589537 RepID=UPI00046AC87F|nr:Crp/Fnr family transcriptional regulator [Prevotella dentasini]
MYDKLILLPLFIGIGSEDLQTILGTTKFRFMKLEPGKILVRESDKCELLYFLIDGTLTAATASDDHRYRIAEFLHAPAVIQPELLFGLTQHHTRTYLAHTACNLFALDKSEVLRLMDEHLVFRLNFLNTVSTAAQRAARLPWQRQPDDIRSRFTAFVRQHSLRPAGEKVLHIKMNDLAREIHESRLNVSRLLNTLQAEGLLTLARGQITIPALEELREGPLHTAL